MNYPVFYPVVGDTLPVMFATYDGGTGASITASGLAVTDIEIYKDGSATQRASDSGYSLLDTDGIDFDGITGIHGFSIDLSDNSDAGFYAVGSWYYVIVSAITVDGQTVSFIACAFRIDAAGVTLADGAHGGTSTVITAERIVVASTTTNQPAVKLTGDGNGAGLEATGGSNGAGMKLAGVAGGSGLYAVGGAAGNGILANGAIGLSAVATSSHGIHASGVASGHGINASGGTSSGSGINTAAGFGSSGDGITASKGPGGSGYDIDADIQGNLSGSVGSLDTQAKADVNAEADAALADYDGPTNTEMLAAFAALNDPTAAAIVSALMAEAVETGLTFKNAMRIIAAAVGGKLSGAATTTNTIRNAVADDKDRLTATVDADGNRTAITYDLTD